MKEITRTRVAFCPCTTVTVGQGVFPVKWTAPEAMATSKYVLHKFYTSRQGRRTRNKPRPRAWVNVTFATFWLRYNFI